MHVPSEITIRGEWGNYGHRCLNLCFFASSSATLKLTCVADAYEASPQYDMDKYRKRYSVFKLSMQKDSIPRLLAGNTGHLMGQMRTRKEVD